MAETRITKRDKAGRWLPGASAKSPGAPKNTKSMRIKAAIIDATSIEQAKRIFRNLAKRAEKGEPWAVKLYLRYVAGDPKHGYDPRMSLLADEGRTQEQVTLRDQLIYLRGAADAVEAQLRAQEEAERDE